MANRTCIKLKTVDQRLTVVQQPILASGDVGMVRVEYELDNYWDGLTPCGTFYFGKTPEDVYEQPLVDGACIIPWEVLTEDGTLYIGLRGVGEDGRIKTAAPVRYRIEKGSPSGGNTSAEPSPDVYQQILTVAGEAERAADEAERIAQSVRDDADAGLFNGAVKVAEDVFIIMTESVAHKSVQITRKNSLAVAVPVITLARYTNDTSDTNRNDLAVPLEVHGDYLHAYNVKAEAVVVRVDVYELGVAAEGGGTGAPGADGRGISSAKVNSSGELVLTYTDGTTSNVGKVVGSDGEDGEDGASSTITVESITGGHRLTITTTDGLNVTEETIDVMDGQNGNAGRGIKSIARTSGSGAAGATDTYTITYSDNTTSTFSVYNGKNGSNGTSVTVSNVSTSTADGGSNVVTFSDGKTLTVKNGSKGSNGTSATHSWSGTTLTVTSASGTTSADLKGAKGDKGDKGDSVTTAQVIAAMSKETWTFTLEDGTTVTKVVPLV